jgi:hypothetical protein
MQKIFMALLGVASLTTLAFFAAPRTHAQTAATAGASGGGQPQFLMTWQALDSYAPAGYAGQILPNQESEIAASLEVIGVNGKPVNLSGQTIYWYQNDTLLGGGVGDQRFTFHPFGQAPTTITLSVQLPDYPTGLLIHEINIPVVQPEAIIEAAYPGGNVAASPINVQAMPYFFAIGSSTSPLSFSWSVNGQTVTSAENPQTLQISLPQSTPAGFAVAIDLTVENSIDSVTASGNANLTYSPALK